MRKLGFSANILSHSCSNAIWSCLDKESGISQTVVGFLQYFLVPGWRMSNPIYGTPSVQHTVQQPVFCLTTAELPNPLSKMFCKQFSVFPLVQNCSRMESKGFFFLVLYSRWARTWHPLRPARPQSYVTENELIVKVLVKISYEWSISYWGVVDMYLVKLWWSIWSAINDYWFNISNVHVLWGDMQ